MCGINGIFAYQGGADLRIEAELIETRDHMAARGPDGSGTWWSGSRQIGLAHRRLAIIDIDDRAIQPMCSDDDRYIIVFNGEIYNLPDLRAFLLSKGYVFRTTSDTEALLHLYDYEGAEMLGRLRGMFAFAIWDQTQQCLFLARDPFGIKPLYYSDDGAAFRFGSQVKALLAGGAISDEVDTAGIVGFHLWGSVPEPFTTHASIKALPAGANMWVRPGTGIVSLNSYVNLASEIAKGGQLLVDPAELRKRVRKAARDSVAAHLLADVEVGLFLSAGIDSGALLGLMKDVGVNHVHTITLGFDNFVGTDDDEVPLAAEVARQYGARHTVRRIGQTEFEADLPAILDAMDQPSIDGINTWFVAKAAREAGLKVVLSGLGADEILAGYPGFKQVPRMARTLRPISSIPALGKAASRLVEAGGLTRDRPKLAGLFEYGGTLEGAYLLRRSLFLPSEISNILDPEFTVAGLARLDALGLLRANLDPDPGCDVGRVAALELGTYTRNQLLRDADWAGMAHSVEVRTPFLDIEFLRQVAPLMPAISGTMGKQALAASPSLPLPKSVTKRAKSGFAVPTGRWMADAADKALRQVGTVPATRKGLASRDWARFVWAQDPRPARGPEETSR
jgi:asparagine synthase (glutamine-hydrolysing)